jgi:hypothetical protein
MKYYCKSCGLEFSAYPIFECPNCQCSDCYEQIPNHETVEEWEKRKGHKYPDTAPVWVMFKVKEVHVRVDATKKVGEPYWVLYVWGDTKGWRKNNPIVVATEVGAPDDSWRPE